VRRPGNVRCRVAVSFRGVEHDLVLDEQRRRLQATIGWARKLRATLQATVEACGDRVHFRPSSTGVAMIGLLSERPQRGKAGLANVERVARDFEALFEQHCVRVEQGRVTGEKALQSFLIRDAQTHGRKMAAINAACADGTELVFVTDEIALPVDGGKMVCDILALRRDGGRCVPVLLELKDDRMLTRLVEQVRGYAALIDAHSDLFAELYGALLGERVVFDAPTEKWIVWPAVGDGPDPRESELAEKGIRCVGYRQSGASYSFSVGAAPLKAGPARGAE
jgi:hypothetical protein